jgi:transcriptional regulator with XRE-family HTH domain
MGRKKLNPNKFCKIIGQNVKTLRKERGWTLEDCEEKGWQSWTHLQRIESGKNITIITLVNLANLFGVHPSELLKE